MIIGSVWFSLTTLFIVLILMIFLCYKGCSPIWVFIGAAIILALCNGYPVLNILLGNFLDGAAGFWKNLMFKALTALIFASFFSAAGAAKAVSGLLEKIVMLLTKGDKTSAVAKGYAMSTISVFAMVMCLLGIDSSCAPFIFIPICFSLFKNLDIPRNYIPGVIIGGVAIAAVAPGSPIFVNTLCCMIFGTKPSSALVPGIIGAAAMLCLTVWYLMRQGKKITEKGLHYEEPEKRGSGGGMGGGFSLLFPEPYVKPVNPILAFIPLIVLFVVYNFVGLGLELSNVIAIAVCFILFWKNIFTLENRKFSFKTTGNALNTSVSSWAPTILLFGCSAGLATVVKLTPAYDVIVQFFTNMAQSVGGIFSVAMCSVFSGFLVGNATQSMYFTSDIFMKNLEAFNLTAPMLHRITTFACAILDTAPFAPSVCVQTVLVGLKLKDTYRHIFVTSVLVPAVGLILCCLLCGFFPRLA